MSLIKILFGKKPLFCVQTNQHAHVQSCSLNKDSNTSYIKEKSPFICALLGGVTSKMSRKKLEKTKKLN